MKRRRLVYGICGSVWLTLVAGCGDKHDTHGAVTALTPTSTPVFTSAPSRTPVSTLTPTLTALPTSTPTLTPASTPSATSPMSTPAPISSDLGFSGNGGGCYPMAAIVDSPLDMLTLINPEWSPVIHGMTVASQPVLIHGTILGSHGDTGGDFPSTHVRSDQNTFVRADDADFGLVSTGNDPNQGALEIALEWEAGAYPDWAWGSAGDRIVALGRWIFDCGHPAPRPGQCSTTHSQPCIIDTDCSQAKCSACTASETCVGTHFGYSSEMHPPYATAVIRSGRGAVLSADPQARAVPATRTDVFVSSFAGGAGDECVLTHLTNPMRQLAVECYPLSKPVGAAHMNDRDFEFDVPLPPRPAAAAHAVWRVDDRPAPGGIAPTVDVESFESATDPYVHVGVRLTQPTAAGLPTGYAATLFAGWDSDATPLAHVRMRVDSVVIHNALQRRTPVIPRVCSSNSAECATAGDCPVGDTCLGVGTWKQWRLQVAVNGEWRELTGLQSVSQGNVIPQSIVYDQYLPAGAELQIIANGVAEDCINAFFGRSLKSDLNEVGFADGVNCLGATPHNAGEVNVSRPVPGLGPTTTYDDRSAGGDGGACAVATDRLCVVDTDCPGNETCTRTGGSFALRYRIERVP